MACDRILHHGAKITPDFYSLTPLDYAAFEGVPILEGFLVGGGCGGSSSQACA